MKKEIDTWNDDDKLICPYCGHENNIDNKMFLTDCLDYGCVENEKCENCGKTFIAAKHNCYRDLYVYQTWKK